MIKVICDGCGKVLPENGENCVNVDFNHYSLPKGRFTHVKDHEINLCLDCAELVTGFVAEMLAKNIEERRLIEGDK